MTYQFTIDVRTQNKPAWRPVVSASEPSLGECIAAVMLNVHYYQTECEYETRFEIIEECDECYGRGRVDATRRGKTKICPSCKGKNSTQVLVADQPVKPMAGYGTGSYAYY